jgi:hypothetical protein
VSRPDRTSIAIGIAGTLSIVAVTAHLAAAQGFNPWQESRLMRSLNDYWAPPSGSTLGKLTNNEVIVVDTKGFDIHKGGAKRDLSPHIDKLHAKEVTHGAVIFRSGDKLYIVNGKEMASE